ncbi:MAG: DUF927 domain-containing protein [Lachnospiraceae bacterium]|nr:DUF927 domain-containing protein [Ruminococcus sp.]MCM1275357.1 DUF927 domain-containing protein [Lachnospiraceae bacterium]
MTFYTSDGDCYGTLDKNGNLIPIDKDIQVIAVEKNIENGETHLTLAYEMANQLSNVCCKATELQQELNKAGYIVVSSHMHTLNQYIRQQCDTLTANCIHSGLGWDEFDDRFIFKGYKAIGVDLSYCGNVNIKPSGEIEDFRNDYENVIHGHVPLEASVIIGLSACIIGYLSKATNIEQPSIVFDFNGSTTTGKTTCARLAVSMGGATKCASNQVSLAATCSATANALYGLLRNNFGYPMMFDETARLGENFKYTEMLYALADGTDKMRMARGGGLSPTQHWATAIIFTGEFSLLSKASEAGGLSSRVVPLSNVQWTESAEQAHGVEAFSKSYAGLPITYLADYMLSLAPEDVANLYQTEVSSLVGRINIDDKIRERVAKSVAVIAVTATLAEQALNIKFHKEDVIRFFLKNISCNLPENEAARALDYIINKYSENRGKFLSPPTNSDDSNYDAARRDCWGIFERNQPKNGQGRFTCLLTITQNKFLEWLNDGGFSNHDTILRRWRDDGVLRCQKKDRFYSKIVFEKGGAPVKCIRIYTNLGEVDKSKDTFKDIFFKSAFKSALDKYSSANPYHGYIAKLNEMIALLDTDRLETGLAEEIINKCVKTDINLPLVQRYLYGQEHDDWCKRREKEGVENNALSDENKCEQETLE